VLRDPVNLDFYAVTVVEDPDIVVTALASGCPGPGSKCIVLLMAACESLKIATLVPPCASLVPLLLQRTFEAQFRLPIALRSTRPFFLCQGSCRRLSNRFRSNTPLRLPLSHRPFESHLSTTSRHLIPLSPPCLSPMRYLRLLVAWLEKVDIVESIRDYQTFSLFLRILRISCNP
jgi:hypothetical protein